jgi:thiamine biosynthesis protein ThiS
VSAELSIALTLNGEPHLAAAGSTVLDLLTSLGREPRTVAVERNGEILQRGLYAGTRLAEGDRIEVVHFVQGGSALGGRGALDGRRRT